MTTMTTYAEVVEGVRATIAAYTQAHDALHHDDGGWRFHRRAAEFVPGHPG